MCPLKTAASFSLPGIAGTPVEREMEWRIALADFEQVPLVLHPPNTSAPFLQAHTARGQAAPSEVEKTAAWESLVELAQQHGVVDRFQERAPPKSARQATSDDSRLLGLGMGLFAPQSM